jgi:molybdate transport system regulatory protein
MGTRSAHAMAEDKSEKIDAFLVLRSGGRLLVGRDRIRLLEAVVEHGSITKAAKVTGFSYKTAWEAVDAINNLLPTPAFITRAGGRVGGSAEVTEEGRRLIATFHRLEDRLTSISSMIAEEGLDGIEDALHWTTGFKISTRNVFRTEVTQVRRWPVDVEIALKVSEENSIHAIVTNGATEELGLVPGRRVLALVKASFIHLVPLAQASSVRRNLFRGVVKRRVDAELNSEVLLDIGNGKTMVAVVPRHRVEDLGIAEEAEAAATFDPNHVILAVD